MQRHGGVYVGWRTRSSTAWRPASAGEVLPVPNVGPELLPPSPASPVSHPCVVQYYGSYIADGELSILMEWASGGDLAAVIKAAQDERRWVHFLSPYS